MLGQMCAVVPAVYVVLLGYIAGSGSRPPQFEIPLPDYQNCGILDPQPIDQVHSTSVHAHLIICVTTLLAVIHSPACFQLTWWYPLHA